MSGSAGLCRWSPAAVKRACRRAVGAVIMGSVSSRLRAMATETMAIIEADGYLSPSGQDVRFAPGVEAAVAGTRLHLPDEKVPAPQPYGAAMSSDE